MVSAERRRSYRLAYDDVLLAGLLELPRIQNLARSFSLLRKTECMAHGFRIHELVEHVLIHRSRLEKRPALFRGKLARAIPEKQGIRIESVRWAHRPIPPEIRSNALWHRFAIS